MDLALTTSVAGLAVSSRSAIWSSFSRRPPVLLSLLVGSWGCRRKYILEHGERGPVSGGSVGNYHRASQEMRDPNSIPDRGDAAHCGDPIQLFVEVNDMHIYCGLFTAPKSA